MRLALKIVGIIVGLFVLVTLVQVAASESGEVVVVTSKDTNGEDQETRLWVVDHEGSAWLRSGSEDSGWVQRLLANPSVTVKRGDTAYNATAVADKAAATTINRLVNEKYGWADDFIGLTVGGWDNSIAFRLER